MSECALTMFPYGVLDIRRVTFGHSDVSEAAAPSLRSNSRLFINQQIFGADHKKRDVSTKVCTSQC
jgi:hypothetical protein